MAEGKGDYMPKVDLHKDQRHLNQAQLDYMKILQAKNQERVKRLHILKRRNVVTAGVLGFGVAAIFGYSLWSVGNEKFLEEPGK